MHHGVLGAATASRSLAAGNAVLALAPHVGAAASQAWTNRRLRGLLLRALDDGRSPAEAVEGVSGWDRDPERRQVAALALDGRGAHRTGAGCSPWAGGLVAPGVVVVGNLLAGPEVLDAMLTAWQRGDDRAQTAQDVAHRLLGALYAGEGAGGDRRGRQSAGVQVATASADDLWPPQLAVDLRVDDADRPLDELARLLGLPGAVATTG